MNYRPRKRLLDIGLIGFVIVAIIVVAIFILNGGKMPGTGLIECKGTTGVYREYDAYSDNYQRYTVPDDPACMNGSR